MVLSISFTISILNKGGSAVNAASWFVLAILVLIVAAILWKLIRDRKSGKSISCETCSGRSGCDHVNHPEEDVFPRYKRDKDLEEPKVKKIR